MWRCHTAVLIEPWELRLAGHLNFDDEDKMMLFQSKTIMTDEFLKQFLPVNK